MIIERETYSSSSHVEGVSLGTVDGSGHNLGGSACSEGVGQGEVSGRGRGRRDGSSRNAGAERNRVNSDGRNGWSTRAQRALGVQKAVFVVASLAHGSQSSDGSKRNLGEKHCEVYVLMELFSWEKLMLGTEVCWSCSRKIGWTRQREFLSRSKEGMRSQFARSS